MNELSLQMANGVYVESDYENSHLSLKNSKRSLQNNIQHEIQWRTVIDGTYEADILSGTALGEKLNLKIEGLRLEKSITGRVNPKGGSIYEIADIERAEGTSYFDTPLTSIGVGQTIEFQHPTGTATTTIASRYIGGGFENGDFENVTISTNGTVDSFSGWEAHRRQVMLRPNPDILQSDTNLSANETSGTISMDETVLDSIKTFSDDFF